MPATAPSPSRGAAGFRLLPHLRPADEEGRGEVGEGVDEEGERGAEPVDEEAGDAVAADHRDGAAAVQQRAGVDVLLAVDEADEDHVVDDAEEDPERAAGEGDDVELGQGEDAEERRHRDRQQQQRAADVGGDHQRLAPAGGCRPRRRGGSRRAGSGRGRPRSGGPSGPRRRRAPATASSGSASRVISSPKSEIVCPVQKLRKERFLRSSGGIGGRRTLSPLAPARPAERRGR